MDAVRGVWLFFPKSKKINSGNDAVNLRVSYVSKEFFKLLEIGNLKEITVTCSVYFGFTYIIYLKQIDTVVLLKIKLIWHLPKVIMENVFLLDSF